MATVWRTMAHWDKHEEALKWIRKEERVAIGHAYLGDLRQYADPESISKAVGEALPSYANYGAMGRPLYDFCNTIRTGDLMIVSGVGYRALVAEVTGEYEQVDPSRSCVSGDDWINQRAIRILPYSPDLVWKLAGARPAPGYNVRWNLIRCALPVDIKHDLDRDLLSSNR